MSQREEKYCSPSKQKEKLENNNPCWSGRRLNSLVLCSTLRSPEWKTRLKCTLPSQGQKKERSDEIMIRKGKINELLTSLRVGCAGFMNVRTYSWPCTGICEKCATAASLCAWPIRSESAEIQRSWNSALLKFGAPDTSLRMGLTTSSWRALCAPQLTKGPARSETTLDVALESHPGALN